MLQIFILLSTLNAHALSELSPLVTWTNTNNDFHLLEGQIKSAFTPGWGVMVANAGGEAQGDKFRLASLALTYTAKTKSWELSADLGVSTRRSDDKGAAEYLVGSAGVERKVGADSGIRLDGGHALFAKDLQTAYAMDEALRGGWYKVSGHFRLSRHWRGDFFHRQIFLRDANTRSDQDLGFYYGLSPDWPWIWLGFGVENLTDTITTHPYWSPRQFVTYGPRFDAAFPITERWSFALGLNLNKFRDIDFGEGLGYYSTAKIIYEQNENLRVEIGYEGIKSEQGANIWRSEAATIGLRWAH